MLRRSALRLGLGLLAGATLALTPATALAHQAAFAPPANSWHAVWNAVFPVWTPWSASRTGIAQDPGDQIVSSQIELARGVARLQLELADGRRLDITFRDGEVLSDGRSIGVAPRGGALDRAWRDLLTRGMELSNAEFAELLAGWSPPSGETGAALEREFARIFAPSPTARASARNHSSDTVAALQRRIAELERRLEKATADDADDEPTRRRTVVRTIDRRDSVGGPWYAPLRHIGRGLAGILADLMVLMVLTGIGFAVVFFARKPLEVVADTARKETMRSALVGLAATFLVLPAYILGIIALAISLIGIPLLLAWVPFFWVVVGIAAIFGYLAVGHALGEALTERRFYGGEWANRTNSYYYVLIGLSALFALFIASHVVQMAGPWFGFIRGFLQFLAIVGTWLAVTIGLGAVLLTRGGTRRRVEPTPPDSPELDLDDLFEEESHV